MKENTPQPADLASLRKRADRIFASALWAFYLFGLLISFEYGTQAIAFGAGTLCLAVYFASKWLLPRTRFYQYVGSGVVAVFTAQFIYQMHGMFEMHFFVFIGATLLIVYENWRLQLPNILLVVVHHLVFAYWQAQGNENVYFTQMEYMDVKTFIIHAGLAAVLVGICGFWSYVIEQKTRHELFAHADVALRMDNVKKNIGFAEAISQGNLDSRYEITNDHDELGRSLMRMQDSLLSARKKEHQDRFLSSGLAEMGEILRRNTDLDTLAYEITNRLVTYVGANQGGLFLVEDRETAPYLRLAACYAFERRKYLQKRIEIGEGLVGQCVQEGGTILLTDVPADYVHITSGLGRATPRCLLVVPLKFNDIMEGVIELASFKPLEPFEIGFVEKLAENIASSVSTTRTTIRTQQLLADMTQQTEEMRAQEEEMRQNLEEMQAIHEQQARLENELKDKLAELDEAKREIEEIRVQEAARANEQIEKRNNLMQQAVKEFKQREEEMSQKIRRQEEEIATYKND